ncbi:MAG TPA: S24/S26 family peptidase [Anaerolineales bacterium]|nr:S24/S26 family peptidase [Anaerolineales bacterium]
MPSYQNLAVELAAQAPAFRLRINGTSMTPLLRHGDSVILEPVTPASLHRGDIIAFRLGQETITHRIIALEPQKILTLGDNLLQNDPLLLPDAILGRVLVLEQGGRQYQISRGIWPFLHRSLAWWGWQMTAPHRPKWVYRTFRVGFWLARHVAKIFLYLS